MEVSQTAPGKKKVERGGGKGEGSGGEGGFLH